MDITDVLAGMGDKAKAASSRMAKVGTQDKNDALLKIAASIRENKDRILEANRLDLKAAEEAGLTPSMQERLTLNDNRVEGMAVGIEEITALPDPVGQDLGGIKSSDGLDIAKVRVPLGVVGIIYESRPNVTADASALCLKSGNAVILRGGREALLSNKAIIEAIQSGLKSAGLPGDAVQLLETPGREITNAFMGLDALDVLIPRGGPNLKEAVKAHAKVPYIMTGMGLCHLFVDETAQADMATQIAVNAKTQRPSTCNTIETLLIHKNAAKAILPQIAKALEDKGVKLIGDERARDVHPMEAATDQTWSTEYLDLMISVKVVDSVDEAIKHINAYGTQHSESIITSDYFNAEKFLNEIDAAAVYVNASTRFTDGGVFGLGAEMGISTQKLHARGPMGVEQLTTTKFIIRGKGQVRK